MDKDNRELDFFGYDIDFLGDGFLTQEEYKGRAACFVVDFSLSAREILPAMALTCYDIMNSCLLSDGKQTLFGLVTYGNGEPVQPVFTDNPSMILEQMLAAKVGGGSKSGVEDTAAALRLACESMQRIRLEEGGEQEIPPENRIVFLMTDSPSDEKADLRRMIRKDDRFADCPPVRAAVLFVPARSRAFKAHASRYQLPLVDAAGRPDRHRAPYIFSLESAVEKRILGDSEQSGEWIDQLLAAIS